MQGVILIGLRKMDEGLVNTAKVQKAKKEVAKILANKTLGSNLV